MVTAVFGKETHWWATIPGGIIAFIGTSIMFGGTLLKVVAFAGKLWPLALILMGVSILVKANKGHAQEIEEKFAPEK